MKIYIRKKMAVSLITIIFILLTTVFGSAASGTVIVNKAIMREKPDLQSSIKNILPIGTKIFINEMNGDWYSAGLAENSADGWMHKDLILVNEKEETKVKKGVSTASILNIRLTPSINGEIVTRIPDGTYLSVVNAANNWYEVILGTGQKGWAFSEFIKAVPNLPQGSVVEENASLMSDRSVNSTIIRNLGLDETVFVKKYDDGWYNIITEDFTEGWVEINKISINISISSSPDRAGSRSGVLSNIAATAANYLGKRYSFGANGPDSFDCSGFVSYIFRTYYGDYLKNRGISLPRTSRDMATVGTPVSKDQLQAGDLVFFNNGSGRTISHVGIYLENGIFIHASSGRNMRVIKSTIDEGAYLRRYSMAVRL